VLSKSKKFLFSVLVLIFLMVFAPSIVAENTVKIGAILPMTGPSAQSGMNIKNATDIAVEIINNEFPDLEFNLAPTAGLPNLDGAKIEIIYGNSQGQPEFGRAEAERLITINNVDALIGCYNSGVTKTASQVSERYKVPFITGTSTALELTERGFKYFFRTTITDQTYAENIIDFIQDLNHTKGANIKDLALLYGDAQVGVQMFDGIKDVLAERGGFNVVADIKFPFAAVELDSEVTTLKRVDPDFVLADLLPNDAITYIKSAKKLNYNAKVGVVTDSSGFLGVVEAVGEDADYLFNREVFSLELADKKPFLVKLNKMYNDRFGKDLENEDSRAFVTMMVLAEAINQAGSADREAIRKALVETNIPSDQLILGWQGVKFDEKGQNIYGQWMFQQLLKGKLSIVWPFEIASTEPTIPMPKWDER